MLTLPAVSITRMRPFNVSPIYKFPAVSSARPQGPLNLALKAGPSVVPLVCVSVIVVSAPAIVVTVQPVPDVLEE